MAIIRKYLWQSLLILAAVTLFTGAAIAGGVEWAFASLGAMVLIGMLAGIICVLVKILRYSKSVKVSHLEHGNTSTAIHSGNSFQPVVRNKPAERIRIGEEDKRLIMEHIDELFKIEQEKSREKSLEAGPITKEDKKLIMAHIDNLFKIDWEQSQEMLS
jgi:hypothetical protein